MMALLEDADKAPVKDRHHEGSHTRRARHRHATILSMRVSPKGEPEETRKRHGKKKRLTAYDSTLNCS